MSIRYFSEDVSFQLKKPRLTSNWISQVATKEKVVLRGLNYIFCSDAYLLRINQEYLHHDTYTDIITFVMSEPEGPLEGEIYISVDRVAENAHLLEKSFEEELRRVIIHGLLHLIGYRDKTRLEKAEMRKKEDACLSLYHKVSRGTRRTNKPKK